MINENANLSDSLANAQCDVRQRVIGLIVRAAPASARPGTMEDSDSLSSLGLSSLRLIGLFVAVEEAFELSEDALMQLSGNTTIGGLVAICACSKTALSAQ